MRKVVSRATAIRAVVLIFALIGILLIFPARVFTGLLPIEENGERAGSSDYINYENPGPLQEFTAQYDRLSSMDIYVTEMAAGRYMDVVMYNEEGSIILRVYVDTEGVQLPGYVKVPLELNLEVGKTYAVKLLSCRSKYSVGYERITGENPNIGSLTLDYVPVEGAHLDARYNYRLPMSRMKSIAWILGIAAVAAAICLAVGAYFKKHPERNGLFTVADILKYSANPVAALVFGALMIMVFPLKVFDSRPVDIIFYELGLIISAAIVFYAINHKAVKHEKGISFWQSIREENRLQYILIMFSMAMAIWYASAYMNDLYDIFHTISERRMAIWFLIAMLLTLSFREVVNSYNLVWVIGSCIWGSYYFRLHKFAPEEKEGDLNNLILKYGIIIVILAGVLLLNFVRLIVLAVKKKRHGEERNTPSVRPSVFGLLLFIFFIMIIILRNTRVWGIYLALTFTCFNIRLAFWDKKKDYFKILSGGLMMNFAISLLFSWLHRYFAGYVSGRFAFIFHTVTVTAEYFTFMGAAALVMLLVKVVSLERGSSFKELIISAWKEMVLFGFTMSYAIFTVSRTAYLAIIMASLLVICVVISYHSRQFFRIMGVLIAAVILCFPAAFTLQRILPTMAADPVIYVIDDTDEFVRGGADWDNTNFMCVERFVNLFESKILGMDVGTYEFPIDRYNYDISGDGQPLYDEYGRPYDESPDNPENEEYGFDYIRRADGLLASSVFTAAEYTMLLEEMAGYVDTSNILDVFSNGRITIFRSYAKELNLWGHDEMGALLPNGEIAVHAHNTYLQVAYDHGVIVGGLFVILLVFGLSGSIVYYKKNRQKEPLSLMTCAVIIGFAVAGISEWVFQYGNPMTVALMLALAPLTYKVNEK